MLPGFRARSVLALACTAIASASAAIPPPDGQFRLAVDDRGRIDLVARAAPVRDVLTAIDQAVDADLSFPSVPADRRITCDYRTMPVEALLDALGINYVLTWTRRTGTGEDRLVGARVVGEGLTGADLEIRIEIERAVADLRDDTVRFNAMHGLDALVDLGPAAVPALENALESPDYQVRQFAAEALSRMLRWKETYQAPSRRFLEVVVEGMRDDAYPSGKDQDGRSRYSGVCNARRGYEVFVDDPALVDRAETALVGAIHGDDPQQRLVAALVLAENGKTAHVDRLAAILVPHLADNHLHTDGSLAAHALGVLGSSVRGQIAPFVRSPDPQQADLARLVLYHIDNPDAGPGQTGMDRFNSALHDPVVTRSPIQFWGWDAGAFPDHALQFPDR